MAAIGLRVFLTATGLGLAEIAVDSLVKGDAIWVIQMPLAIVAIGWGTAAFFAALLRGDVREEVIDA